MAAIPSELETLKALLWQEWDPIGVNDDHDAFGEYDSYADEIYSMLGDGAGIEDISRHLTWAVVEHMGLGTHETQSAIELNSVMIAAKVVAIHLAYTAG